MEERHPDQLTPAIRIADLSVSFAGRAVLRGLNLDIGPGGPTVVIGRSGSGKTTFLRAINRLNECLPGCTTSGSVTVRLDGRMTDAYAPALPLEDLRRRVGMVFQSPNVLPLGVARNIALPLGLTKRLTPDRIAERTELALREVHLWDEVKDRLNDSAQGLSGGQQQRLCLARALAFEPDVLLLDEPTASLDFKAARRIEELILQLAGRYTVVLVSHSLGQTCRLGGRVLVLSGGERFDPVPRETLRDKAALLEMMEEML